MLTGGDQAARPHPSTALVYNGHIIRDRHEMLSLTDMWKAAGGDLSRQPAEWLRSADAQRFIGFLSETLNLGISQDEAVRVVRGGKSPGTWAHWQIGLAYAKYLSPTQHPRQIAPRRQKSCNPAAFQRLGAAAGRVVAGRGRAALR